MSSDGAHGIDEALSTVAPPAERAADCRKVIGEVITLLKHQRERGEPPRSADLRADLADLEHHLRLSRTAAKRLGKWMPTAALGETSPDEFATTVDGWIRSLQHLVGPAGSGIVVGNGKPRTSLLAQLACECAYTLLIDYSSTRPSSAETGSLVRLAKALLGCAEVHGVSVERSAKHVVRRRRALDDLNAAGRTREN